MAQEGVAHVLDRLAGGDGFQHGVVVENRYLGHRARHDTLGPEMNRRPKLEIVAPNASPEEAAAVVAALEQFMRATAPPLAAPAAKRNEWQHAALYEGVAREQVPPPPWG